MGKIAKYRTSAQKMTPMTKFASFFQKAFYAPPVNAGRSNEAARSARVEIARSRSHGNIRLQLGHWYTQGDVDALRKRLEGYSFVD